MLAIIQACTLLACVGGYGLVRVRSFGFWGFRVQASTTSTTALVLQDIKNKDRGLR